MKHRYDGLNDSISPKRLKILKCEGIVEADVGITRYLDNELSGFKGQIKQRYSDFIVNEIKKDGETVYLVDNGFKMPKYDKPLEENKDLERAKRREFQVEFKLRMELVEILGEEDVAKIEDVYRNCTTMETQKSFDDKSVRTKIHQLLREAFQNKLESVTSSTNNFHIYMANRSTRINKEKLLERTKDANGVVNWGYGPVKNFVHFTVYKENKDTMRVVNTIAKYLRMPTSRIRFAGTKDCRAVTCQRMCISTIGIDRLNALNKILKGVVLGGYQFSDSALNLGDLEGNEFVIVIRNVEPNDVDDLENVLKKGCASLSVNGFINYFGMQRFGTFSISTHEIGKYLLMEHWKTAVDLILSEQENVLPKSIEARKIWVETKDPSLALSRMPKQCLAETAILNALIDQEKDSSGDFTSKVYYNAIMKIPRNLRTIYVHAYQSYVWNFVASKRIELFGTSMIPGDLVLAEENTKLQSDSTEDFDEDLREAHYIRAIPLSQNDIDSGKWDIHDVVLPTPGFDIIYPGNETLKNLYVETMAKNNLDPFNMKRKIRDFSLAGSYRPLIQKTKDIEYRIVKYKENTQQLVNTDLEILNNTKAKNNGRSYMKDKMSRFVPEKGGDKISVILKFKLGVSSYATMALRELMKLETSRRGDMCDIRA